MQADSIAGRCWAEHIRLQNVKDALRVTLNWRAPAVGLSRKLSSVAFIIRALQRHLERQLALEEDGGYLLDLVGEQKPSMLVQANRLRSQHDDFRASLRTLLPSVEQLTPEDRERLEGLSAEICALLDRIDEHDAQEVELLQEAFLQDDGGEG